MTLATHHGILQQFQTWLAMFMSCRCQKDLGGGAWIKVVCGHKLTWRLRLSVSAFDCGGALTAMSQVLLLGYHRGICGLISLYVLNSTVLEPLQLVFRVLLPAFGRKFAARVVFLLVGVQGSK